LLQEKVKFTGTKPLHMFALVREMTCAAEKTICFALTARLATITLDVLLHAPGEILVESRSFAKQACWKTNS
jgi:hypothetical protein